MWDDLKRIFGRGSKPPAASEPLDFRELPDVEGRYTMQIAGEQFDGRQSTIKSLSIGQGLRLRREPYNSFDSNAVAVETRGGEMIGYLSRNNARWVSRILDEGTDLSASVAWLYYGDADGNGIEVQVHVDGVPPRR